MSGTLVHFPWGFLTMNITITMLHVISNIPLGRRLAAITTFVKYCNRFEGDDADIAFEMLPPCA